MKPAEAPQRVWLVHCRAMGDLVHGRCMLLGTGNEVACEGGPCPIYEYVLVRDDEERAA